MHHRMWLADDEGLIFIHAAIDWSLSLFPIGVTAALCSQEQKPNVAWIQRTNTNSTQL